MIERSTRPIFLPPGAAVGAAAPDRPVLSVAGIGRRIAGRLVDTAAALSAVAVPFCALPLIPAFLHEPPGWLLVTAFVLSLVFIAAAVVVLRIGSVAWWGRTLGQYVAGIRIVRHPAGTPARGWRTARARWFFIALGRARTLGPPEDLHRMWADPELRRCEHDLAARTVVVRAERPDTARRVAVATALAALIAAVAVPASVPAFRERITRPAGPPFEAESFYEDEARFSIRAGAHGETYVRTGTRVLDDSAGCRAGAQDDATRTLLARFECDGRIEAVFRTGAGVVVSSHVLRFPDERAADQARRSLRFQGMRPAAGGSLPPDGQAFGNVNHGGRYLVVTASAVGKGPESEKEALRGVALLHTSVANTLLWMD
ncbi:RDD family protein [Spirillospora sp. CA-253888]